MILLDRKRKNLILFNGLALFISFLHFLPVYITLVVSLSKYGEKKSYWKFPSEIQWSNFSEAFKLGDLGRAFFNTLFITVVSVILIVFVASLAAYPLARNKTKLNSRVLTGILAVMMIPSLSLLVPLYNFMIDLNATNTYWGIILIHVTFQLPVAIFLLKNFIETIPVELDEAAVIDGCSIFKIFYKIILPLVKPVISTIIILTGVGIWNDYTYSLYFLQKPELRTMTLAVSSFFSQANQNKNMAAAAAMIGVLPLIILYVILQKQFIKGAVDGAIK